MTAHEFRLADFWSLKALPAAKRLGKGLASIVKEAMTQVAQRLIADLIAGRIAPVN